MGLQLLGQFLPVANKLAACPRSGIVEDEDVTVIER